MVNLVYSSSLSVDKIDHCRIAYATSDQVLVWVEAIEYDINNTGISLATQSFLTGTPSGMYVCMYVCMYMWSIL